jgi:hypothetical protein
MKWGRAEGEWRFKQSINQHDKFLKSKKISFYYHSIRNMWKMEKKE